jgi:site-specific recombinase XerD
VSISDFDKSVLRPREICSALSHSASPALSECQVRPFVLYTLRHTMLTRLGESGCDVWTLARIAGHSNIRISQRYVHPSTAHIERCVNGHELSETGDKTGDNGQLYTKLAPK